MITERGADSDLLREVLAVGPVLGPVRPRGEKDGMEVDEKACSIRDFLLGRVDSF